MKRPLAYAAWILGVAGSYALTARLGLLLEPVGGFATLVWAPTGISIAALLLGGRRVWPGVFLGALVANALSGAPLATAASIATGNTLEAVVAVWLLGRRPGFSIALDRLADVLHFLVVALAAPVVSATVGVASLVLAEIIAPSQVGEAWRSWWIGDFIGALLVAPLIMVWATATQRERRHRLGELVVAGVAAVLLSAVVFFRSSVTRGSFLEAYLVFPVLIWAALRFEQRGTTLVVFLSSVTAIAATVRGSGPFSQQELHGSLLALQTFVGIVATSLLLLAATLAERTRVKRELERAVKAETDANQAKSDFLAVMSHELRTPLNAISGYSQMLSMEVLGPLNPAQRDAVDRIASNESHLASLVEDVLSFTPSHAGKLDLDIQKVNVRKSLEAMEVFMQPQLQKKGINLVIDAADENLVAAADPDRLRQILLNLLTNSLKYTERGGEIRVVATRDNGVCVDVIDTGVGIPADQLGRVFEPFFQVDRGRTRRFEGVGLGLSIARDLVGAMKGEISIKSTESIGTAVRIRLPEA